MIGYGIMRISKDEFDELKAERDEYRKKYERLAEKRQGDYDAAFLALQAERDQLCADNAELLKTLIEACNAGSHDDIYLAGYRAIIAKHQART